MKTKKSFKFAKFAAIEIVLLALASLVVRASVPGQDTRPLSEKVRHELAMQPFYTVFDNISFEVQGGTVTLEGQVTRPFVKSDAENSVKRIAGVNNVIDNIVVLPPSFMDDQIRRAEFRRIFSGSGPLSRYAAGVIPSIHIIVDAQRVMLVGTVATQTDKDMATLLAKEVPGVFSVSNNLTVKKA